MPSTSKVNGAPGLSGHPVLYLVEEVSDSVPELAASPTDVRDLLQKESLATTMAVLLFRLQNLNGQIGPHGTNVVSPAEEEVKQDTEDAPRARIPLLIPVLERLWTSEIARNCLVEIRSLTLWSESGLLGSLGVPAPRPVVLVSK